MRPYDPDHFITDDDLDIEIRLGLFEGHAEQTLADFELIRRLLGVDRSDHDARAFCERAPQGAAS